MREIGKYRGRRIDTGEWVSGSLVNNLWGYTKGNNPVFEILTTQYVSERDYYDSWEDILDDNIVYQVDPCTVGEYTGLKEFPSCEGDIVAKFEKHYDDEDNEQWKKVGEWPIVYGGEDDYPAFTLEGYDSDVNALSDIISNSDHWVKFEIIGTVHD